MEKNRYRIFSNIKLCLIGCLLLMFSSCGSEVPSVIDYSSEIATEFNTDTGGAQVSKVESQDIEKTGKLMLYKQLSVAEDGGESSIKFRLYENNEFELGVYLPELPEKDWEVLFYDNKMVISCADIGYISITIYDDVDAAYYESYIENVEVVGEDIDATAATNWIENSSEIVDWDNEIHKFSAFGVIDDRNVVVSYEFDTSYIEEYLPYLKIISGEVYWRIDQSRFCPGFSLLEPEVGSLEEENNLRSTLLLKEQYDVDNVTPIYTTGKTKSYIVGCLINGEIIGIENIIPKDMYGTPFQEDVYIPFARIGDELSLYNTAGIMGKTIINNTSYFISDSSAGINLIATHEDINANIDVNTSTIFALPQHSDIQVIETFYNIEDNSYSLDINDDGIDEIISFEEYETDIDVNPIRLRMLFTKGDNTEPIELASFFNKEESGNFLVTKLPDGTICIITKDTSYEYISYSGVNFYILSDTQFEKVASYYY